MPDFDREWVFLIDPDSLKPFRRLSVRVCSICKALVEEDQLRDHLIWHAEMEARYSG